MSAEALLALPKQRAAGQRAGIPSACSAHPMVIEAILGRAAAEGQRVLIEATCNQVNQDGGYTGMTPQAFREFVEGIAKTVHFPLDHLILGGDHLGPNPWRSLPAVAALDKAAKMVETYVAAGFSKIHLDASMSCAGDPETLAPVVIAERAADLAVIAERTAERLGLPAPVYVIGTEVPTPGGATETLDTLAVTTPAAAEATIAIHREAFDARGIPGAFARTIALVVQPGVEFSHDSVVGYVPSLASDLSAVLRGYPSLVFEAHSTDYQSAAGLASLVNDGFAILKVGPWLTFALREALYGLDHIAAELVPSDAPGLQQAMEALMVSDPGQWKSHYHGSPAEQRLLRHYSYSDRIRYYWTRPEAIAAVGRLLQRLEGVAIPETLISQFLAPVYTAVLEKRVAPTPKALILASINQVFDLYGDACH